MNITMQIHEASGASDGTVQREDSGDKPGAAHFPAKILAVDDNENNLVALRSMLADLGQPIVCARSGEEALRLLLKDDFAIILLDVRMPVMDGYETAAYIRNRQRSSHVPIIFLSAVDKEDRHLFKGYAAGAVDYVFKPIEPVVLRAKVQVFIDLHTKAQEIRRQAEQERRLLEENLRVRAEQFETAEALRRSLAQQSLVIDSLPIALFVASKSDGYRSRRFVGGKPSELLAMPEAQVRDVQDDWADHVHEADRELLETAFQDLEAGGSSSAEYRFNCGNGNTCWFFERMSMAREGDGNSSEVVGVLFDITSRKMMEERIAHTQKLEALGQMTGGIAHDFNNMLGVVIGSLDGLLSRGQPDGKERRQLDLAMQAAMSCADLTRRLLGFGRRQALEPRLIDLHDELKRFAPLFGRLLGKGLSLETNCPPDVWPINLDASQLEAALVNLTINARDAMPAGGRLRIAARNVPRRDLDASVPDLKAGDYVELRVADTGTGMSSDILARALEPFFTTKKAGQGTGLGLSTIYGFVRQSGGGLALDSEPGKGTVVRLYLPRADKRKASRRRQPASAGSADFSGRRIFVVEDDLKMREMAVSFLETTGCTTLTASSGDDALEMEAGIGGLDALFTDCIMPGKTDGPALAREMLRRRPGLRVLMTSGNQTVTLSDLPPDARARFLPKPYNRDQLLRELADLLASDGGR